MRLSKRDAEHYRAVADEYARATGQTTIEVGDAVRWALAAGKLEASPQDLQELLGARMSAALRDHVARDREGRQVRLRYCVAVQTDSKDGAKAVQRYLWSHIDEAPEEFLIQALQQRRAQVRADVESLRADLEYLNERLRQAGKRPIQMSFDFDDEDDAGPVAEGA